MKKFSVLIALALLAVAGTGYAVTCAYDNVPAATLLVPYWRVSLNGATGAPIPHRRRRTRSCRSSTSRRRASSRTSRCGTSTRKAVLDFNVPLTGKDVVSFSMRDIMNGNLNVNSAVRHGRARTGDPCGLGTLGMHPRRTCRRSASGQTQFIRFSHPDAESRSVYATRRRSISQYTFRLDAFGALPRHGVGLARRVRRHHVVHDLRRARTFSTSTTRLAPVAGRTATASTRTTFRATSRSTS